MHQSDHLELNDGHRLPRIGLGTLRLEDADTAVARALGLGYRLIDTAASYGTEAQVGRGIRQSGVPREDIVVTTKLRGSGHGYDETIAALAESLAELDLEYVDYYLIHWPLPRVDKYVDSWRAMIHLRSEGLVRSIGVANFTEQYLTRLVEETGVVPAVNQIELHPYFPQEAMRGVHERLGIVTEAWTPLGKGRDLLDEPAVREIADAHGILPAQAVLGWHRGLGVVPIPKAARVEHQRENLESVSVELDTSEMARLSTMERGRIFGDLADPEIHEEF